MIENKMVIGLCKYIQLKCLVHKLKKGFLSKHDVVSLLSNK